MSYFDDASLVMIPSGYKTSKVYSVKPTDGTGDLTFTRSNDTATRVGPTGLIEKVRTNLVLQSETFNNASWAKTFGASITANTAANPLTGTQTADTIIADATNDFHYISQSITYSAGEATMSVYLKANGYTWFVIDTGFTNAFGYFNLTTGVVGTKGSACTTLITSVGNGWYRCSVTFTATASASSVFLSIRNADNGGAFLGDGVSGFFIYGAQAEMGVATPYIATTTAAVSVGPVANVPRLDYLGSSCPRLLLEPQRVNLALFSESFDNAAWTKSNATITANAAVSPDGTTSADKIVETATTSGHSAYEAISVTNGATYTLSVFAKAAERTRVWVDLFGGSNAGVFDLSTGTIIVTSAGCTTKIENYGNGWYRCAVTAAAPDPTLYINVGPTTGNTTNNSYTGNGTSGILAWGCQLEAGAYATSYIPTLGASVTRGADAASKTGISSLIGQTEGTFFVEAEYPREPSGAAARKLISANDGSSNNLVDIYVTSGLNTLTARLRAGAVGFGSCTTSSVPTGVVKIAYAYKANDYALYINGTLIQAVTTGGAFTFSSPVTIAQIGDGEAGADELGGTIGQALLFKTRLSNADLAALTA